MFTVHNAYPVTICFRLGAWNASAAHINVITIPDDVM